MEGVGADAGPASIVAAEIVAAGGTAVADTNDVASVAGAQALVDTAVERFGRLDILVNNAGIMRWAGFPKADAENLESHLAVHLGGSFNTTRAAWPGMVEQELRPHRHDHLVGDVRAAQQPRVRHGQSRRHRAHAQPQDRRRRARHQGQPHRTRGVDAHGGRGGRRLARSNPDGARPRRADGRVPRARRLSGERRDLRRGRGALRAHLHRLDRGVRPPDIRRRRSRTSRSTGRRSTTRPATTSRPTSWAGRPPSWPTWAEPQELRVRSSRFSTLPDGFLGSSSMSTTCFGTLNFASCRRQCSTSSSGVVVASGELNTT